MNILNLEHISKLFGDKMIFDDASFGVQEGDKVGIIGINGTGKSTLLRMIAGEEEPDGGQIVRQNGLKIAYLSQSPVFEPEDTVLTYASDGKEDAWIVQSNLTRLGIMDFQAKMKTLSGGQRRRAALAKVLAEDFDLLLLDDTFGSWPAALSSRRATLRQGSCFAPAGLRRTRKRFRA